MSLNQNQVEKFVVPSPKDFFSNFNFNVTNDNMFNFGKIMYDSEKKQYYVNCVQGRCGWCMSTLLEEYTDFCFDNDGCNVDVRGSRLKKVYPLYNQYLGTVVRKSVHGGFETVKVYFHIERN